VGRSPAALLNFNWIVDLVHLPGDAQMIRRHYFTAEVFVPSTQLPEKCEVAYLIEKEFIVGNRAILRKVVRDNGDDILADMDADAMSVLESEAIEHYRDEALER